MSCSIAPERLVNLATLKMVMPDIHTRGRHPVKIESNAVIKRKRQAIRRGSKKEIIQTTNVEVAKKISSASDNTLGENVANEAVVVRQELSQKIIDMILEGHSYEYCAMVLRIKTSEVHSMTQDVLGRWIHLESITALELRELEAKRLDRVFNLAVTEAFPHPIISQDTGLPVLNAHGDPIMTTPNPVWAKISIDIMSRRAALYGLDAAQKLEERKAEILERMYIGANPDDL